jgi:hypothetical protein
LLAAQVADGIAQLAWERPGQCLGVVALLACCGALLALQLWMIVLPLRESQVGRSCPAPLPAP